MARLFDDTAGTPEFLSATGAVVEDAPVTFCAWLNTDDDTDDFQIILSVGRAGTDNFWRLRGRPVTNRLEWQVEKTGPPASGQADTTSGPTLNTWHHGAGSDAATNNRRCLIDGGNQGSNSTDVAPKNVNSTWIAQTDDSSPGDRFSGRLGHLAIWNIALNVSMIEALAAGISPLRVARDNLVAYWPVNGRSVEINIMQGGFDMTVNGSPSVVEEPPIPNFLVAP